MALDIVLLTTTISGILTPYLVLGAQKFVEGMAQKVGEQSAEHGGGVAKKLWDRIQSLFQGDDEKAIIAQFEKRPEAAKSLGESILKEKLEQNPALAQELERMVHAPGPSGESGAQIFNAGVAGIVDARGASFAGAQQVRITGVNLGGPTDDAKAPEA